MFIGRMGRILRGRVCYVLAMLFTIVICNECNYIVEMPSAQNAIICS